jgi:hypothetical protein
MLDEYWAEYYEADMCCHILLHNMGHNYRSRKVTQDMHTLHVCRCRCSLINDSKHAAANQNLIYQIPLQMAFTRETETNNKLTVCTLHCQHQQKGFILRHMFRNIIIINHSCLPTRHKHVPINGVPFKVRKKKNSRFQEKLWCLLFSILQSTWCGFQ